MTEDDAWLVHKRFKKSENIAEAYPGGVHLHTSDCSTLLSERDASNKHVIITEESSVKGFEAESVLCVGQPHARIGLLPPGGEPYAFGGRLALPRSRATTSLFHVAEYTADEIVGTRSSRGVEIELQDAFVYTWLPCRSDRRSLRPLTEEERRHLESRERGEYFFLEYVVIMVIVIFVVECVAYYAVALLLNYL